MKINGKKLPGQWLAALVAYGLALPTAGFLGMSRALPATEPPVMEQTEATEETIPESSEVPESDMETETAQEIVEENSFSARYEALPQDQKQLLEDIRVAVAAEDMVQAAKLLDKKQEVLAQIFYGTFEGERFLYDGSTISEEIEGEGGVWSSGKMNGQGATGYCYYENVPQGEYAWVEKQGQFVDDEMEGSISYEIRGTDDTLSHWDMNVSQGKIQLDERWTHLDDAGEYQLMSADSVSHAYLIADDQVDQVLWMNLLGWD